MAGADLLRGLYEAFGRGDMGTVLGTMDPSISWREAEGNPYRMDGVAWVGPNEIVENLFVKLGTEWDGFTVTPAKFLESGDQVIVEGRYTGTYKATGKSIDAQFCHVWDVKNGKVMAFQQYTDTAQFQGAMQGHLV
jgi:ketosteroid isomerase-like protein